MAEDDSSFIATQLAEQNRRLTQALFLYQAACQTSLADLESFKAEGLEKSSSSSQGARNTKRRLSEADKLIQRVVRSLKSVLAEQKELPKNLQVGTVSRPPPVISNERILDEPVERSPEPYPKPPPPPSPHDSPAQKGSNVVVSSASAISQPGSSAREVDERSDTGSDDLLWSDEVPDTLSPVLQKVLHKRDEFWRSRIRSSAEAQHKMAEIEARQLLTRQFNRQLSTEKDRFTEIKAERDHLKSTISEQGKEIATLNTRIEELTTEIEAGFKIVQQFSELMRDKASSVCQYCRRSGTLPPTPTR